ncbi:STAS/SEC14 domain-containing protein [Salinisphaera sp. T31B1]|uniref:STAS/SEC14 domain-containing protein n=1 Tax=Salinisphaera sp. T31B1 TaxID=727963 RepID=UPI00334288E4
MLQTIDFPADHDAVVALELDGEIGDRDFEQVLAAVEARLRQCDTLRLYVEVRSLGKVSPQTVVKDLRAAVKHWNRFDKLALVTDISAIRTAIGTASRFMPGIELEAFDFHHRESARQWIIA